jgi:hypothetical protein
MNTEIDTKDKSYTELKRKRKVNEEQAQLASQAE